MPHQRSSGGLSCVANVLPRPFHHSEDRHFSAPIPSPHFRLGRPNQPRRTLRTCLAASGPATPLKRRQGFGFGFCLCFSFCLCFITYISTVSDGCSLRYSLGTGSQDREPPRSKKRDCVCRSGPHPKTDSVTALNAAGSAYMIHVKPSCVSHRAVLPTAPQLGNWLPYVCSVPREATPT